MLAHGETAATVMAAVDAELSGAPGACLVTRGPGAASAVNGVAQALLDRVPLVLVTDAVSAGDSTRISHQRLDQDALYGPITKWSVSIDTDGGCSQRVVAQSSRSVSYQTRRQGGRTGVAGWEYVHVIVDDHSRLADAEVLEGLTAADAIAFLRRALDWFRERGVRVQAVMSDNCSCYVAQAHSAPLHELDLRHVRIQPPSARSSRTKTGEGGTHC